MKFVCLRLQIEMPPKRKTSDPPVPLQTSSADAYIKAAVIIFSLIFVIAITAIVWYFYRYAEMIKSNIKARRQ
jgi:hypothetical protein